YLAFLEDRFGDELPKTPTPRDIVKLLNLDEVEWRISRRQARLLFDGQSLQWIEGGQVERRWPAASGKPGFNGKEHQSLKD
ncbi:hypothetical protein DDJ66_32225, partial [Klebsiella oxytoca]